MQRFRVKIGQTFGLPLEVPIYILIDIIGDEVIIGWRDNPEESLGAMMHEADYQRTERAKKLPKIEADWKAFDKGQADFVD